MFRQSMYYAIIRTIRIFLSYKCIHLCCITPICERVTFVLKIVWPTYYSQWSPSSLYITNDEHCISHYKNNFSLIAHVINYRSSSMCFLIDCKKIIYYYTYFPKKKRYFFIRFKSANHIHVLKSNTKIDA